MSPIDSHPSAAQAITNYLVTEATAEDPAFRAKMMAAMEHMAPPVRYHDIVETVYANRDLASAAAKQLAACLARFSAGEGLMGFSVDRRGSKIAEILTAEAEGEPVPMALDEQPAPQAHFAVPAEEPEDPGEAE